MFSPMFRQCVGRDRVANLASRCGCHERFDSPMSSLATPGVEPFVYESGKVPHHFLVLLAGAGGTRVVAHSGSRTLSGGSGLALLHLLLARQNHLERLFVFQLCLCRLCQQLLLRDTQVYICMQARQLFRQEVCRWMWEIYRPEGYTGETWMSAASASTCPSRALQETGTQ